MKNKLLCIALCILLSIGLYGCGGKAKKDTKTTYLEDRTTASLTTHMEVTETQYETDTQEDIETYNETTMPEIHFNLSEKEANEAKKAYYDLFELGQGGNDDELEKVQIKKYYGTYMGCVVAMYVSTAPVLPAQTFEYVDGIQIRYPSINYIYAYKGGKLYRLGTAFENGMLKREHIISIVKIHMGLDHDVEKKAIEAYKKYLYEFDPNLDVNDIEINVTKIFGNYNGSVALTFDYYLNSQKIQKETVDSNEFYYEDERRIYVYSGEKIFTLQEAFYSGSLLREDIESLVVKNQTSSKYTIPQ